MKRLEKEGTRYYQEDVGGTWGGRTGNVCTSSYKAATTGAPAVFAIWSQVREELWPDKGGFAWEVRRRLGDFPPPRFPAAFLQRASASLKYTYQGGIRGLIVRFSPYSWWKGRIVWVGEPSAARLESRTGGVYLLSGTQEKNPAEAKRGRRICFFLGKHRGGGQPNRRVKS